METEGMESRELCVDEQLVNGTVPEAFNCVS